MSEKYATLEILAQHGKTSVVKAKHLVTGRVVALKKTSPENRETLRKEAQSLGKLKHPNIVSVISMIEEKSAKGIPLGKSPHLFQKEISHSPRRIRNDNPELFRHPHNCCVQY